MTTQTHTPPNDREDAALLEKVVVGGDLSKLSAPERLEYYRRVCESLQLNPLTQPFAYVTLRGRGLTLYALKGATDQLRRIHQVSITTVSVQYESDLAIVSVQACDRGGRTDSDLGVVSVAGLRGEDRANAILKAVTKAKRRVTLSICGLGMLDESEVDDIPSAVLEQAPAPRHLAATTATTMSAEGKMPDRDTQLRLWKRIDAAQQALLALDPSATLKEHPSTQVERTRYWQEADAYVAQLEEAARLLERAADPVEEEEVSPI
jgi:hypothetical protein